MTDPVLYIYGSCIEDDRNGRTIPNSLVVVLLPKSFEKEGREGLRMWTLSTKCIWFSLWSKLFLLRLPTGTKSSFPSSLNHSLEIEAIFVQSRPRHRPYGGVLHVAPLLRRLPVSLFTHLALGGSTPSTITARLMLKDRGVNLTSRQRKDGRRRCTSHSSK